MVYPAAVLPADFSARLADWDPPFGPLRDVDAIPGEMLRLAAELGPDAAPALAELVCAPHRAHALEFDALEEFIQRYAVGHGPALAAALLARLRPYGPASLVSALGSAYSPDASAALRATLDLTDVSDNFLIVLIDTLGELADPAAVAFLHAIADRDPPPSRVVQDELEIVLRHAARG